MCYGGKENQERGGTEVVGCQVEWLGGLMFSIMIISLIIVIALYMGIMEGK